MLSFFKKWNYYYKQDKKSRACMEVNGNNFVNEINDVIKTDEKEIANKKKRDSFKSTQNSNDLSYNSTHADYIYNDYDDSL